LLSIITFVDSKIIDVSNKKKYIKNIFYHRKMPYYINRFNRITTLDTGDTTVNVTCVFTYIKNYLCHYDSPATFSNLNDDTNFTYNPNDNTKLICQKKGQYEFSIPSGWTIYINGAPGGFANWAYILSPNDEITATCSAVSDTTIDSTGNPSCPVASKTTTMTIKLNYYL
jgi:hypothetical protein